MNETRVCICDIIKGVCFLWVRVTEEARTQQPVPRVPAVLWQATSHMQITRWVTLLQRRLASLYTFNIDYPSWVLPDQETLVMTSIIYITSSKPCSWNMAREVEGSRPASGNVCRKSPVGTRKQMCATDYM